MDSKLLFPLLGIALLVIFREKIAEDWRSFKANRKLWFEGKWENWIKPLLVAAILAVAIRTFILGPYKIPTGSMRPNLMEGDRIFVDKMTYRFREPRRGEVIVFKYPLDRKKDFVKRLIAFGGETVEIREGQIYINGGRLENPLSIATRFYYNREDWDFAKKGQKILVPKEHLFMLGDNSAQSSDSRNWGFVRRKDVVGRAVLIWWPPNRLRLMQD